MGRVLEEHIVSGKRTLDRSLTYQLVDMLQDVMDRGTGAITRRMGFVLPAAGKTGTTNERRDSWFVGYTRNRVAVSWVGLDDNRPASVTGSNAAMRVRICGWDTQGITALM